MARLEDDQKRSLPPPPAPPRRGANPWKLSGTARKPESRPESFNRNVLDELMKHAPADVARTEAQAPPKASNTRASPGLPFLVITGIAILIVLRIFFEARDGGDWQGMIAPLVVIAFIAHGWWKMRQRREANKTKPD
jgi:hypothetical protein